MNSNLIGNKRNRDKKESEIYDKMKTPDISTDKLNYFLSQIKSEYEEGINYSFSFENKLKENIIAICLWGYLPLYEGRVLNFTKQVKIDQIAKWANMGGVDRTFEFFSNIQSLFYIDNDNYKKLSFFEDGKYGFIFEGKNDYFLIMNIKSLKKFNYIDKNSDYCKFWILKMTDIQLIKLLGLDLKDSLAKDLSNKVKEYQKKLEEKDQCIQGERLEYVDRINKLIKDKEVECEMLKKKFNQQLDEQKEIIEKYKSAKIKNITRPKKFIGLKEISYSFCIKDEQEQNIVLSFQDFDNEDKEDENITKQDFSCILCCIRVRNIFFDRCHHCCICEQCLEKCYHKFNKKTKQNEYFCPICNNDTQRDDKDSFTDVKKIIYA